MSKKNVFPYDRRDFTLSFNMGSEPEYFIDNNKKKVTCVITGKLNVPFVTRYMTDADTPFIDEVKFKASAKAVCSDKDVFDVERGMRIALAKAELKIYRQARAYMIEQSEYIRFMANKALDFIMAANAFEVHNAEHISVLSDVDNPNYMKDLRPLKNGKITYKK